jgi:hypothetical protein
MMQAMSSIKKYLENRLLDEHKFWSFEKGSCRNLSDRDLIKYVLMHLDLKDINCLFQLYPKQKIKQVWLEELAPQGDYLISMNICFALLYFNAKKPKQFVRSMETRMLNKMIEDERRLG